MIKYFHVPEQKKTIAVLEGCKWDCVNKIEKVLDSTSLRINYRKYMMPDTFRAVVVCHPEDEYSPEEGERRAKRKLLDRYYEVLDKKQELFAEALNTAMFELTNRMSCSKHQPRE